MTAVELIESYWDRLIRGGDDLGELFGAGQLVLDAPHTGRISSHTALADYARNTHRWLAGLEACCYTPVDTTQNDQRVVHECVLTFKVPGKESVDLPIALVGDTSGRHIVWLRIYHSTWPLQGKHDVRTPLLPARFDLVIPDVVGRYQAALADGNLEGILAAFEPDGCAREPSGGRYLHCGPEGLRELYTTLFSNGGGIPLEHCTVTDDGVRCAIEYNVVQWGRTRLPAQAGVAVYQRNPQGKLAAARIYDDVELSAA